MRKNVRKFQHFFPYNCKCPFSSHAKCEENCEENSSTISVYGFLTLRLEKSSHISEEKCEESFFPLATYFFTISTH